MSLGLESRVQALTILDESILRLKGLGFEIVGWAVD